jgi:hypothetical protein
MPTVVIIVTIARRDSMPLPVARPVIAIPGAPPVNMIVPVSIVSGMIISGKTHCGK